MVNVPDFDALYRVDSDPWRVQSSFYESRKLDLVLACLSRPTYTAAWDPASGVGELAARLAPRAGRVLASDASAQAVHLTRHRCRSLSNVTVLQLALPQPPPTEAGAFDLIVLSEFFYYLGDEQRARALAAVQEVAADRAELVAVHWRHHPNDGFLQASRSRTRSSDSSSRPTGSTSSSTTIATSSSMCWTGATRRCLFLNVGLGHQQAHSARSQPHQELIMPRSDWALRTALPSPSLLK